MKKIAFMFAAAAMFVACQEAPKVATAEQVDSIYNALKAECQAQADAVEVEYVLAEGAEAIDSAACVAAAEAKKAEIMAAADTTNADFKAAFEAAVKAFETALNAPAK
ncbi:MAG: hypothetical protein K6D55_09755 [Prevotella sp.]|nr:hypothetical protein [Prevotella sp.]